MTGIRSVPNNFVEPHRSALEAIRAELKAAFIERDEAIDLILSALLARQHILLLGPPGTAKSALVDAIAASIEGATRFSWAMSRFTVPEEIFGPVSLKALQEDRFARITSGKAATAHVVFLDEIFKASSAVLNTLLTLMNERVYFNDGRPEPCPLLSLIGASNELPESAELEALSDRLLIRHEVKYVVDHRGLRRLVSARVGSTVSKIDLQDLERCQTEASSVTVPDEVIEAALKIKTLTEEQGFRASDRRWQQAIVFLKARAYLDGEDVVSEEHLEVLADVLWRHPKDRSAISSIIGRVASPLGFRALEILDAARDAVQSVGGVDASDPNARADWVRKASLAESRLGDMQRELEDLAKKNTGRGVRRVHEVESTIKGMRVDLTRRVAETYKL